MARKSGNSVSGLAQRIAQGRHVGPAQGRLLPADIQLTEPAEAVFVVHQLLAVVLPVGRMGMQEAVASLVDLVRRDGTEFEG